MRRLKSAKHRRPVHAARLRARIRHIVRICAFLAHRKLAPDQFAVLVDFVLDKLGTRQRRDILLGDYGRSYRAAMMLTLPFFTIAHSPNR